MNNPKDCPEKSNDGVAVNFVDAAEMKRLTKDELINERARKIAQWQSETLPKAEADNAARLHPRNKRSLREAGAAIDKHRAGEGRDTYNRKQREAYEEKKGSKPREYVAGLSEEDRAERDRVKNVEAQSKVRSKKTTAQQSAERAERRRKAKEREAEAAELGAIAREATRKTF